MTKALTQFACSLALGTTLLLHAGMAGAINVGEAAPAFSLPNGRGEALALERLRGQVVYVDFWASWCAPCRRSFPWMNQMQQKYGSRGFTIVAINVDKKRSDAERLLQQNPAMFALVYDETGATPAEYGVKGMPSSYLIDARGNIAFIETGFFDSRGNSLLPVDPRKRGSSPGAHPGPCPGSAACDFEVGASNPAGALAPLTPLLYRRYTESMPLKHDPAGVTGATWNTSASKNQSELVLTDAHSICDGV